MNPALFLTQALRSLEEAAALEGQGNDTSIGNALRIYTTLIQYVFRVFILYKIFAHLIRQQDVPECIHAQRSCWPRAHQAARR